MRAAGYRRLPPMNPEPESAPSREPAPSKEAAGPQFRAPRDWREAVTTLISTRAALIQWESREALSHVARKGIFLGAVAACAFFAWALILAGSIAWISSAVGVAWPAFALLAGFLHVLAAVILLGKAKKPSPPAFTVTRAEFQKDREWIENFQKTPKS